MSSFSSARFRELARSFGLELGHPLTAVDETPSTNDLALEAARQGAPHGATFVAEHQTRGRGRQGRTWYAPRGESLLFSVLLRPRMSVARAPALPLAVGLALRSVVAQRVPTHVKVELKWPNDVLADRRKLCGVLVESQLRGSELSAVVVGAGLNVRTLDFPEELQVKAGSLSLLGAQELEREPLLALCLAELDRYVKRVEEHGLEALAPELKEHDALVGRCVEVGGVTGLAAGVDAVGRLIVTDENGVEHKVVSGHVSVLDR